MNNLLAIPHFPVNTTVNFLLNGNTFNSNKTLTEKCEEIQQTNKQTNIHLFLLSSPLNMNVQTLILRMIF